MFEEGLDNAIIEGNGGDTLSKSEHCKRILADLTVIYTAPWIFIMQQDQDFYCAYDIVKEHATPLMDFMIQLGRRGGVFDDTLFKRFARVLRMKGYGKAHETLPEASQTVNDYVLYDLVMKTIGIPSLADTPWIFIADDGDDRYAVTYTNLEKIEYERSPTVFLLASLFETQEAKEKRQITKYMISKLLKKEEEEEEGEDEDGDE